MEPSLAPCSRSGLLTSAIRIPFADSAPKNNITLSSFFPPGTEYFYGYPAGSNPHFFNIDPPATDELTSMRIISCAGDTVTPVVYPVAEDKIVHRILRDEIGVWDENRCSTLSLQTEISLSVTGAARNKLLRDALLQRTTKGKLMMAQPYLEEELCAQYSIAPALTNWLNDKKNLPSFVPSSYLPERYATFKNGLEFAESPLQLPIPCVVKISSSSGGDGVRICRTSDQLLQARKFFRMTESDIIVEECITVVSNFGIQFGIPADPAKDIKLIGVSEQLTTPEGAFIGGIIDPSKLFTRIDGVNDLLLHHILPTIREFGWYGIGGVDILVDNRERFFIVDPNFRTTGMTAFLFAAHNGDIRKCMAVFTGTFEGSLRSFSRAVAPIAHYQSENQRIHIIALTRHGSTFRMNAALLFDREEERHVPQYAEELLTLGIESDALSKLSRKRRIHYPNFPHAVVTHGRDA